MIIRRAKRSRNFTVVGNEIMDDPRLTDELGILIYLLSRPDNWRISVEQLQKRFSYGRDKVQRIMRTLREAGYARLEKLHDPATGKWQGNGYVVSDEPAQLASEEQAAEAVETEQAEDVVSALTVTATGGHREPENTVLGEKVNTESLKNRLPDNPTAGKHGSLIRTDSVTNTDSEQIPLRPPGAGEGLACATWEEFDAAWRWNPVDIKAQGQRAFEALSPEHRALAVRYAAAYGDECRRRTRKIPNARTWLRDRGWEALAAATAKASPKGVFIEAGSAQHAAWSRHHGKPLFVADMACADGVRRKGRYEPTEWPPPKSRRVDGDDGQANSQLHAAG